MCINCFWISGQYKGKGYVNRLLEECIRDAGSRGCCGLTVITLEKKCPLLSDPDYLRYKGFSTADTAASFFAFYYLPFSGSTPVPRLQGYVERGKIEGKDMVPYYTNQCPHIDKYVSVIVNLTKEHGAKISVRKIETTRQAQPVSTPFTTYNFFYDGEFVANEVLGPAELEKFLDQHGL